MRWLQVKAVSSVAAFKRRLQYAADLVADAELFVGMADRMTEIQQHPLAGIQFVILYDPPFTVAAGVDDLIHIEL